MLRTADQLDDILSNAFTRVRSVPDEVTERVREKLRQGLLTGASTAQVLRSLLAIDEADLDERDLDPAALREALQEIWNKSRTDYQRILRTETVNAYAKVQLQEWFDNGITRVTRHSIDDSRTCAKCRQLSKPGKNIYFIEDLLTLEHPVTEDSDNPGSFLTHPNCRCTFQPVVEDLEAHLRELEKAFLSDIETTDTRTPTEVKDVPLGSQESVTRMAEEMREGGAYAFVPDVTKLPDWNGSASGDEVISWKAPDGTTYINNKVRFQTHTTYPLAQGEGRASWERLPGNLRRWVQKRWRAKHKEMDQTLDVDGVKIVGGPPFFSAIAAESAEQYFVESYAHYMVDPAVLVMLDPPMYSWLQSEVFQGTDYLDDGGVR